MTKITIPDTADLLARIEALETMNTTLARELRQIKAKIAIKGGSASHPTMWAYEQACAALDKHKARAQRAESAFNEIIMEATSRNHAIDIARRAREGGE